MRRKKPDLKPREDPLQLPRDPLRLALMVLMVLTLSRVHQALGLGFIRPGLSLAGLACLYVFLNPHAVATGTARTWPVVAMTVLATAACLSIPMGLSIGSSVSYFLSDYSKVLLFAALLVLSIRGPRDIYLFVLAWVLANGILVWMAFFVFDLSAVGSRAARLGDMYGYDANDNGLILVVGIPLSVLAFRMTGRIGKVVTGGILLGSVATVALTGSRGAFVALAFVALSLLFFVEGISLGRRFAVLGALATALLLAAPQGYWDQMRTIMTPTEDYNWVSETGRLAVARRGLGYMLDRPLLGIGLHNFQRAEGTISSMALNAMPGQGIPWLAPHNSYVQAAAEMGVPGGLAFLTMVVGGVVGMARLRSRVPWQWRRGGAEERFLFHAPLYLAISYLGFAVAALFLSFAYLDPIYILSALSAGIYASVRRKVRRATPPLRAGRIKGMRGGLAVVERGG